MRARTAPRHLAALTWLPVLFQLAGLGCGDTLIDVIVPADAGGGAGDPGAGGGAADCAPSLAACEGGCVDLSTNNANCGACGVVCSGGAFCGAGRCVCREGDGMCNGVCTFLDADPQNCGACGIRCGSGQFCRHGVCEEGCPPPQISCDGECVDPEWSDGDCGCGDMCDEGEECHDGECDCVAPEVRCGESCVDLRSDGEHCGDCDVWCGDRSVCVDGICQ
ncbi:hypothetical protein [Sorangium sp. So ce1000]|uniref:hypothetical protein n=1 Tax=Sorangium sp. So ce1000 TaxID=3133325 RepID=UPI003F645C9E